MPQHTSPHELRPQMEGLDEMARAVLDFERTWTGPPALREAEILERFGMSTARYHQLLNQIIDHPAAAAHDPLLVGRLRRLRERRQQVRSAARLPR